VNKERPRNLAASVRHRLMELARKQGEDFQLVLTRFIIERLLYRLFQSDYRTQFVLKGALLFRLWADQPHRPTRDLDLLGKGEASLEALTQVFADVCTAAVEEDGLTYDPSSVTAERIKEDQAYEGVRVRCRAHLGQARVDLQIDVGFGDVVVPRATAVIYPAMLEFPAPVLPAYPREAVVAEKFQAMVALGIANSRMKDFFDLWVLAHRFAFEGSSLCRAVHATFRRRKTALPAEPPVALTPAFATDPAKMKQWTAFVKRGRLDAGGITLEQVCMFLSAFLMPLTQALLAGGIWARGWQPGGPWAEENLKLH
jgi:predicted nucleotidyltransferase component of viral defense system